MKSSPEQFDQNPSSRLITPTGHLLHEQYMCMREKAMDVILPDGLYMQEIQKATGAWFEDRFPLESIDFSNYDEKAVRAKMLGLADFVRINFPDAIPDQIIHANELFIERSFGMFNDWKMGLRNPDSRAISAFAVPMRASTERDDYSREVKKPSARILDFLPGKYVGLACAGLPPLILDEFNSGNYLVLVPILDDARIQAGDNPEKQLKAWADAVNKTNDTIDFCHEYLGATFIGEGAVIPRIMGYTSRVRNKNVISTTGHGGTVDLMIKKVLQSYDHDGINIGVAGLGAIGLSVAKIVSQRFEGANISIYDNREKALRNGYDQISQIGRKPEVAKEIVDLLRRSDVVISAITEFVDLSNVDIDLSGVKIIDDSEPRCFSPEQVASLGGKMTGVIGRDTKGIAVLKSYDYGGNFVQPNDGFGCGYEVETLAREYKENIEGGMSETEALEKARKNAIQGPVDIEGAKRTGERFDKYEIVASPDQIDGRYT